MAIGVDREDPYCAIDAEGSEGTAEDENTGPRVRAGWGEAPLISPLSSHLANTGEHWRTLANTGSAAHVW